MRLDTAATVRATLRFHPDGLTLLEIAHFAGVPYRAVHRAILKMPDTYIDRWQSPVGKHRYQAVWCVVPVPANCPRPNKKGTK